MSLLLAAFVLALSLLCAWAVVYFGRKHGESETKLRLLVILFVGGGLVASVFAYRVDSGMRRTTLFEVVVEGIDGADVVDGTAVHRLAFDVEHIDVEHDVLVAPKPEGGRDAAIPVTLRVRILAPGGSALLDETRVFEIRTESTGSRARAAGLHRKIWDSASWRVTPKALGRHLVELWHLTPGIPTVHVRLADPLKTDGVRAPGY